MKRNTKIEMKTHKTKIIIDNNNNTTITTYSMYIRLLVSGVCVRALTSYSVAVVVRYGRLFTSRNKSINFLGSCYELSIVDGPFHFSVVVFFFRFLNSRFVSLRSFYFVSRIYFIKYNHFHA